MCIRDRVVTIKINGGGIAKGVTVTGYQNAVSYTHLDVYKRQEIGNHSYKHPIFSKIGEERIKEELRKTDEVVEKYTGKKPSVFRFPSGDYNAQSYRTVTSLGYKCIQWDADSVDWKEQGEEVEYNKVMKKVKAGSILLYHNNAKYTPSNLNRIIPELQKQGYKFVTVGELIYTEDAYVCLLYTSRCV